MKYEIIERTYTGCETLTTAETLTAAITECENLYAENGGERLSSEESYEVLFGGKVVYIAG